MLDLADFMQVQPEDNKKNILMVSISQAWYNGSYSTAAKSIKSLELHNTMIQILIININNYPAKSRRKSPNT